MLSDGEQWHPSDVMDAEFAGVAASACSGIAATERDLERAPGDGVGKSDASVDVVAELGTARTCASGGARGRSRRPKMGATGALVPLTGNGAVVDDDV
jgi:hypothetical protein